MDNKKTVHQGEIFRILIKRSKMRVEDVAEKMDVRPSSLSRSFANENLTAKARRQAAQILGVDEKIFETGLGYEIPESRQDRVEDYGEEYRALLEENERLTAENAKMAEDLLREKSISDDLRRVLVQIAGKGAADAPDDKMQFVGDYREKNR